MMGSQYTDDVKRSLIENCYGPVPVRMDPIKRKRIIRKWRMDEDILRKDAENIMPIYIMAYIIGRMIEMVAEDRCRITRNAKESA